MDVAQGVVISLVALAIWVALFLVFRQVVLWYFRINERTELLRDIRDSLRNMDPARVSYVPDNSRPASVAGAPDEVRRRPGESDDSFNSRVATELERQLRGR